MNQEFTPPKEGPTETLFEGNFWLISPQIENADKAAEELEKRLKNAEWSEEEINNFPLAVAEAILNGMIHGIYKMKREKNETKENFDERVSAKSREIMSDSGEGKMTVGVEINLDQDGIIVRITDSGDGFLMYTVPDPTDSVNLLEPTGRGVDLMKKLSDSVEFRGNSVILKKERLRG